MEWKRQIWTENLILMVFKQNIAEQSKTTTDWLFNEYEWIPNGHSHFTSSKKRDCRKRDANHHFFLCSAIFYKDSISHTKSNWCIWFDIRPRIRFSVHFGHCHNRRYLLYVYLENKTIENSIIKYQNFYRKVCEDLGRWIISMIEKNGTNW